MKENLENLVKLHFLDKNSFVIDCGAYKGDYTSLVYYKFGCKVLYLEPQPLYFYECKLRFGNNPDIFGIQAALSGMSKVSDLYLNEESSSLFKEWAGSKDSIEINELRATDLIGFVRKNSFHKINALKLNCEGAEYRIIKDLDFSDNLKNIDEILVQFHKLNKKLKNEPTIYFPDYQKGYKETTDILSKTHNREYNSKWEFWRIKEN